MKKRILTCLLILFLSAAGYADWQNMWVKVVILDDTHRRLDVVEKKLARALDKINIIVEENATYLLKGQIDVRDEQTVDGFAGATTVVRCDLGLSLVYLTTKSTIGSESFTATGGGKNKKEAIRKAYRNFKFSSKDLEPLFARAKEKIKIKIEQINEELLKEGKKLYDQSEKDAALIILSGIDPATTSFQPAQELIVIIKKEQWEEWQLQLKHEQKIMREKSLQDSLRAETKRFEAEKAQALAQAWQDSLNTVKTIAETKENELRIKQIERQAQQAFEQAEILKKQEKEAAGVFSKSKQLFQKIKHSIVGGPDQMPAEVTRHLARKKINSPSNLVGKWSGRKYTFSFSKSGKFVMTTADEPGRVSGDYVVSGNTISMMVTDPPMSAEESIRLVTYKFDSTGGLVVESPLGSRMRFTKM